MAPRTCSSLQEIREQIDALDAQIVRLLVERGGYVVQAAAFKRDADAVRAPDRAAQVVENARRLATEAGGNPDVAARVYREIVSAFTDAELAVHHAIKGR
jgi:isochorismate pyruvate lyase